MMDKNEMAALEDAMSNLTFDDIDEAIEHMADFFMSKRK